MNRAPVPALRHDPSPARTKIRIATAVWKQHGYFGRNAGSGLVLQHARSDHVFEGSRGILQNHWVGRWQRCEDASFEYRFQLLGEPKIKDKSGCNKKALGTLPYGFGRA